MYTNNNNRVAKSAEKLSSGYRVNRAGDDAAGLAISEKMRAQIRGLNMAAKNSNDAISLVQTAEGALQEVQNMLQRMNELAVQSASDTNVTIDRNALQLEFEQLQDEIDQIARTTKFNDTVLLDGSFGGGAGAGNVSANLPLDEIAATTASTKFTAIANLAAHQSTDALNYNVSWTENGVDKSVNIGFTFSAAGANAKLIAEDGTEYNIAAATATATEIGDAILKELQKNSDITSAFNVTQPAAGSFQFEAKTEGAAGAAVTAAGLTGTLNNANISTGNTIQTVATDIVVGKDAEQLIDVGSMDVITGTTAVSEEDLEAATFEIFGEKFILVAGTGTGPDTLSNLGSDVNVLELAGTTWADATDTALVAAEISRITGEEFVGFTTASGSYAAGDIVYKGEQELAAGSGEAAGGIVIQVGAEEGHTLDLSIESMNTTGLGITKAQANIATREAASAAITTSRDAINKISMQRATLGAMQNRLEYKVNNLSTTVENLQAAESRIRDVDMAQEMSNFTKNNILVQASTAMLAQANSLPQNVLQLLG